MVVTKVGRQALVNAAQNGTASVVITHIGVGSGKYTPTENQTALVAETKRSQVIEGGATGDGAIHVAMQDADTQAYTVYEIGIFLADGTLFAVCSQSEPIIQKTAATELLLAIDATFVDVDTTQISFGAVSFSNAAATTDNAGIVTLATDVEAQAGTDDKKVLTPAALLAVKASLNAFGLVQVASNEESIAGKDKAKVVTPEALAATLKDRVATTAEALQSAVDDKFVTPKVLKSVTATTNRAGLVELATEEEAVGGTDETHVLTPATAAALFDRLIREWQGGN